MTLPTRSIGPFAVSSIGLGCMNLNHAYGVAPAEADAIALLNRALDIGVSMLDTAALYGGGANERLLAKAVMHRRLEFRLASKCVLESIDGKRMLDGSPAAITASVDRSLSRLGTDHIDLMYLHRLDRAVPVEESVGSLVRLKEAGKIGAIGLSEVSADTLRRAHAVHPIAAVQSEYSPMVRNPDVGVIAACRDISAALVAFSPLARGLLAGSVRNDDYVDGDIRTAMPRFRNPDLAHNLSAVDAFDTFAAELGMTSAQLSLAWALSRGDHVVPIPGTRSIAHLEQNLAAADMALDTYALEQIETIFAPGTIRGPRYSAAVQAQIDTELIDGEALA
jgi:aryl-alcohol dehydrogenase-like predicted oxidoreductase